MKKTVDVHSDEEDYQEDDEEEEEDEDEDNMESDADKSGEDDMEEVRYPRWKRFSFFAPFLSAAPGFFDAF